MNYRSLSAPRLFIYAFFALFICSTAAAAQTFEPDEQIRREMVAYVRKTENAFDSSHTRVVAEIDAAAKSVRVSSAAPLKTSGGESSKSAAFALEHRAFELLNEQRRAKGLQPLRWSEDAARVARVHSENMARYKFFSHTGIDGKSVTARADALGIDGWRSIGENIVYNRGFKQPVESACQQWMNSPAHRENLMNEKWNEAGIGAAIAPDGSYYFTQVFILK